MPYIICRPSKLKQDKTYKFQRSHMNCKVSTFFFLAILKPLWIGPTEAQTQFVDTQSIKPITEAVTPFRHAAEEIKGCLFNVLIVTKNEALIVRTYITQARSVVIFSITHK